MSPNNIALRVSKTLLELVKDRKFVVPDDLAKLNGKDYGVMAFISDFVDQSGSFGKLSKLYKHRRDDTYMYFHVCAYSGTSYSPVRTDIRSFLSSVVQYKEDLGDKLVCAVFISEIPLSTPNLKLIGDKSITDPGTIYQTYLFDELLFNPTKHVLVPKHHLLTNAEENRLYKDFNKTLTDPRPVYIATKSHRDNVMPVLRIKNIHGGDMTKNDEIGDPIAKWYLAKPSNVFKITRKNFFADTTVDVSIAYKYVI